MYTYRGTSPFPQSLKPLPRSTKSMVMSGGGGAFWNFLRREASICSSVGGVLLYIYIYIYRERERQRERWRDIETYIHVYVHT